MFVNIKDMIDVSNDENFRIESESIYEKFDDLIDEKKIKCLSREIIISKTHIIESSGNSEPDKSYVGVEINVITTFINDVRESKYLLRCKEPTVFCLAEDWVDAGSIHTIVY